MGQSLESTSIDEAPGYPTGGLGRPLRVKLRDRLQKEVRARDKTLPDELHGQIG